MTALYILAAEMRALFDALDAADFDPQTVADTLDGAALDFDAKVIACAMEIENAAAEADAIGAAIERMQARQKRAENRADRISAYVLQCMNAAKRDRVSSPEVEVLRRKNPVSVVIAPGTVLADKWLAPQKPAPDREPDKAKIKAALQDKEVIDGCTLSEAHRLVLA
jgi:chaperonin GroEL (HSP60 family)